MTSRRIPREKFGDFSVADIDSGTGPKVIDFWLKQPISASSGVNNFDGQFKVTNDGASPVGLNALALQILDKNGSVVLDRIQDESGLAGGAIAHMQPGAATGAINVPGSYTAIAKVKINGAWREIAKQTFTVDP